MRRFEKLLIGLVVDQAWLKALFRAGSKGFGLAIDNALPGPVRKGSVVPVDQASNGPIRKGLVEPERNALYRSINFCLWPEDDQFIAY